jgi:hypothetical protein
MYLSFPFISHWAKCLLSLLYQRFMHTRQNLIATTFALFFREFGRIYRPKLSLFLRVAGAIAWLAL